MLKSYLNKGIIEVGCDEAGRGCLAGPVVAAAVILPKKFKNSLLNDSKKLTDRQRNELRPIIEKEAIAYAVAFVDNIKIDEINILNASFLAIHLALDQLNNPFEHILIDGNRFKKYKDYPHTCVIKGDGKLMSIAAASILAKTYRDEYMLNIHKQYPHYVWNNNMGYPTKKHREAIRQYGVTSYHRMSYRLLPTQLELDF